MNKINTRKALNPAYRKHKPLRKDVNAFTDELLNKFAISQMKVMLENTTDIHRYTKFALPAWRYIPKYEIHPTKNPTKNHIPNLPKTDLKFSATNWQKSARYLYAIDLFNYQYYWEVHEVLEKLWLETGKNTPEGIFLKGIIQLAVALLKKIEGNTNGVLRLTEKAIPKIHTQTKVYLGIDIKDFTTQYQLFIDDKIDTQLVINLHNS